MTDDAARAKRILQGAAALGLMVKAHVDTEHGEIDRFELLGLPLFRRTDGDGLPVICGVTFPRWIRGPRGS